MVSALAVYPDATTAANAFEQARADIDGCVRLGPASGEWDPVEGATASGPTYWQLSTTPAPEVCTECGTAWVHAQGVALVDDRIAAVTISWIGDLEGLVGAEAPGPMAAALERAAEVARGAADRLRLVISGHPEPPGWAANRARRASLSSMEREVRVTDPLDLELEDAELSDEIALVAELMAVASASETALSQARIDQILLGLPHTA